MDDKNFEAMLTAYIEKEKRRLIFRVIGGGMGGFMGAAAYTPPLVIDEINFLQLQEENGGETFSEMLMRFIRESGEKNSNIYKRANIDRRHFSKICTHKDYKPSKQTVLAFALALKLDFDKTQRFLASAGYTLNKTILSDMIVSFFIEYKIFDVDLANQALYKYDQPLLGG